MFELQSEKSEYDKETPQLHSADQPTAPGEGGTLIFSYIRRLGSFFGFKTLNFNIFGGFQKNEYFWGYEDFVDIFWGSSQNWTIFRCHFLRARYRMGDIFGGG